MPARGHVACKTDTFNLHSCQSDNLQKTQPRAAFDIHSTPIFCSPNMSLSTSTNLLFNAAPRAAYQAGAYDGFYSYAELLKQGDFGLGATDKNGGELLLLNGAVYRSRVNGITDQLGPHEKHLLPQ
jgi:hypothetical protein